MTVKIIRTIILGLLLATASFADTQPTDDVIDISQSNDAVNFILTDDADVPVYIEGTLSRPAPVGGELATALAFFKKNRATFKIAEPLEELKVRWSGTDNIGQHHIRLRQIYRGLRVIGGDLAVHFDKAGAIKTVNGNFIPDIEISTSPTISSSTAETAAVNTLDSKTKITRLPESELVIFPRENDNKLCWLVTMKTVRPLGRWEFFVDAATGEIIFQQNKIMDIAANGTGYSVIGDFRTTIETDFENDVYQMIDKTRQFNNNIRGYNGQMPDTSVIQTNLGGSTYPGEPAADADNNWDSIFQAPAVDAQVFMGAMYDWWLREFDRNSYNDSGSTLSCTVDFEGEGSNNAYWDGERIVVLTPSVNRRSLAGCPEVIAHEFGHAITEYTSELAYLKEPGALNESFSDMIGSAFEWAHDTLDIPDWSLGENSFTDGTASRHMADPHLYSDPDYYGVTDAYWYDVEICDPIPGNDWCGIHSNSGVPNKWFQLLSDGGVHHDITVTGIGVSNAIKIAYRANVYYWTSGTDFPQAAFGTVSAANDLDPSGTWASAVIAAWQAVGVTVPQPKILFKYMDGIPYVVGRNSQSILNIFLKSLYGADIIPGSGLLHYSINDAPYLTETITHIDSNQYRIVLPALECEQNLKFYLSFEESSIGTLYDPDPSHPHRVIPVTKSTIAFFDDFNSDRGWTVTGDAVSGKWARGVPYGNGLRGDPLNDFDGSQFCFVTRNGSGDTDVDGGTTILTSPQFNVPDSSYRLYYARWYANYYGKNPHSDTMRIYISNNNGLNWNLLEEIGSVEETSGGWLVNSFTVGDIIEPTDQMRLKIEASDLYPGSTVEAAFDAFIVRKDRCFQFACGDVNCSDTGEPDISDIVRLIDYLYLSHNPLCYPASADVDGSGGEPDISDISRLINHLYISGLALNCQ